MSSTSANAASAATDTALLGERTDIGQPAPGSSSRFGRGDRALAVRATLALVIANARYWSTVAPVVRVELARWRTRADAITDTELRALALSKLDHERFNAEAGAMLATLAPRAHRREVVQAIVALQVLFDLLDGLTERPLKDPLADGERLFMPFTDALHRGVDSTAAPDGVKDGYLWELSGAVTSALADLPAREAVIEAAAASAQRAAQAQVRMHAAPRLGVEQLRQWAQTHARGTDLQWRELAAGAASSVLAVHALIAAAADVSSTPARAGRIANAYLPICVLLTLLDSLIDEERDARAGEVGYISLYQDRVLLAEDLLAVTRRATALARELNHGAYHVMMLTGVVAYYTSVPDARGELARPVVAQLHTALAPLITPTLVLMRAWRLARRLRGGTV